MPGLAQQTGILQSVAQAISPVVPMYSGCTLGGSRAYQVDDGESDVEMYFYSLAEPPTLDCVNDCMHQLGAAHRRSPDFMWDRPPWGPHSFFELDGLYFEVGYRNVYDMSSRLLAYLKGSVQPERDCHDLGLGYMPGGLAASVHAERVIDARGDEIAKLKQLVARFPHHLRAALEAEYLDTARSLLDGKVSLAAKRGDVFAYDALAARVVRAMMVMAFALSSTHFPGDKWNEALLRRSSWRNVDKFLALLRTHSGDPGSDSEHLRAKHALLGRALALLEREAT
jgi:hypothetical protein